MKKARKLYDSPNGDTWYLIRDPSGEMFVRHEVNIASGGQVEHVGVAEFLSTGLGIALTTGGVGTDRAAASQRFLLALEIGTPHHYASRCSSRSRY